MLVKGKAGLVALARRERGICQSLRKIMPEPPP